MERLGRTLLAGCLFLTPVVSAQGQQTCSLVQITNTTGAGISNLSPTINATGNRIAFDSNADLLGSNGDGGFEIFLWDEATGLTQITNFNSPSTLTPSINAAGNRIAFTSNANPLGSNGDGNFEIFLWDASTGFAQITNTSFGFNSVPTIDAAGTHIAFNSNANPLGTNADFSYEIFLWDAATGLTQITNGTIVASFSPQINANGNRIVFQSETNPLGGNGDANFEIFIWDTATGFTQITNTTSGDSYFPTINSLGDRIAFASSSNILGNNTDENFELFFWASAAGFTQITNTADVTSFFSPDMNAAGNRIAFESNADFFGNSGGIGSYEIFLWEEGSSNFTQITNSDRNSGASSINAAGDRIAFTSSGNFLGGNGDGNEEIFLAYCQGALAEFSVPTVSPLGLAALAVLLGLAAAWTLRRREPV